MAINSAIIRIRRGPKDDLRIDKLLPGELAMATDAPVMWFCWAPGNIEQVPTSENITEIVAEIIKEYLKDNPVTGISEIYMRVADGFIQYSSDNETWNNLLALEDITGTDGNDGYSPSVNISKDGKVTTITITDKNGEHTVTINDGADGKDGKDGKTAYQYAQDGGYTGTEAQFSQKLAKEYPSKTSELENDSEFITKAVSDLANYYLKSETYSKSEINQRLSAIPKFAIQVVASLPLSGDSTTVYLLKSGDEESNLYTEYIYVNGRWEFLGSQSIAAGIPTKLSELTNDTGYITKAVTDLANYYNKIASDNKYQPKGNYLTEHQDLSGYAKKATTLSGYGIADGATKEEFNQLSHEIDDYKVATPQMYEGTDAEKIQQAINENQYVLIPVGTYSVTDTITIPSNRKIQIEGTINVSCSVGFLLHGEYIDICGKGTINIGTSTCSAIKALVDTSIGFVKIRDITMWGAWNHNNSNNHIGIEFVGGSTVGTCCYVDIDCYINCMTKAVWTHKATGQNADSWITQIDINSIIQNCQQAIVFDWMGDMSRIRGVIQPKVTSAVTPNSVDLPLCILPEYGYIDSAIWDMDGAINKHAIKVNGNYCTILSVLSRSYIDINIAYEPTLTLRIPTDNLVTKEYFEENKPSLNVKFHIDNDGNLIMEENAPYTNLVPSGKDTDGSILNDVGYVDNYRISASGNITGQTGTVLTGHIPYREVSDLDDIKTKGVSYVADLYCGIMLYDEDYKLMGGLRLIEGESPSLLNETVPILHTVGSSISVDEEGIATIHLNFVEDNLVNNPVSYFRLFAKGEGSDLIVTRKENIVPYNPIETNVGKVVPETNYSTEEWTFTYEDGSTETKKVVLA